MQNIWTEIKLWWAALLWMLGAASEGVAWALRRRLGLVREDLQFKAGRRVSNR
jgi:hypothetical protein